MTNDPSEELGQISTTEDVIELKVGLTDETEVRIEITGHKSPDHALIALSVVGTDDFLNELKEQLTA